MPIEVSVVIPNFNKSPYLEWALRSVLTQTLDSFEAIVVDDASTDDSISTVEKMMKEDSRVRLLLHRKNVGGAAARNDGIRACNSQLISFLDSDDLFGSDRLENMVQVMQNSPEPTVVYTDRMLIDSTVRAIQTKRLDNVRRPSGFVVGEMLAGIEQFSGALIGLPRSCFDVVGLFDESLAWAQDLEMCLRLAAAFRFTYDNRASYGYRIHPGNSTNRIPRRVRYHIQAEVLERHFVKNVGRLDPATRSRAFSTLFTCYVGSRDWRKMLSAGLSNETGLRLLATLPIRRANRVLGRG